MGRLKDIISREFTGFKRGLVTDEEFKIPISAISAVGNHDNAAIVRVSLDEKQVKHGYEFAKGNPTPNLQAGLRNLSQRFRVKGK